VSPLLIPGGGWRVNCLAFSPNGTTIAAGCSDKSVKLWNASTGEAAGQLLGHDVEIRTLVFSQDGSKIVLGDINGGIRNGSELKSFAGPPEHIGLILSRDGGLVLAANRRHILALIDIQTVNRLHTFYGMTHSITGVSFAHDGSKLAAACLDGQIKIWDAHSGSELTSKHTNPVIEHLEFTNDGTRLISAGADVRVWDAQNGEELMRIDSEAESGLAISGDETQIEIAKQNGNIELWKVTPGLQSQSFSTHLAPVLSVALTEDGNQLATGMSTLLKILGRQINRWYPNKTFGLPAASG